jgi:hypothetical protein
MPFYLLAGDSKRQHESNHAFAINLLQIVMSQFGLHDYTCTAHQQRRKEKGRTIAFKWKFAMSLCARASMKKYMLGAVWYLRMTRV